MLLIDAMVPRAGHDGGSSYVLQLLEAYDGYGFDPTLLPEAELSAPADALGPRIVAREVRPQQRIGIGRAVGMGDEAQAVEICKALRRGRAPGHQQAQRVMAGALAVQPGMGGRVVRDAQVIGPGGHALDHARLRRGFQ